MSAAKFSEAFKEQHVGSKSLSPHILFFLTYNLLYFLPLFAVFLWGYGGGGAEDIVAMNASTMLRIGGAYLSGTIAFALGSWSGPFLRWSIKGVSNQEWNPVWFRGSIVEIAFTAVIVVVFIISKIALIPTGVYREYAFDADLMSTSIWSFSTFCSETLILIAILVLFQKKRRNVLGFFFITAINCANLLHGTRVFFISSVMSFIGYLYVKGYLPVRRVLMYGPPAFLSLLFVTYAVYLSRMAVSFSGAFSLTLLVSPIMYESMFSQLSLIGTLSQPWVWDATGHIPRLVEDITLFIMPRIILPDKDSFMYINQFNYLSPKGAFNGYATGLVYLGLFFPCFYFVLGIIGNCLYQLSQRSAWWFVLYMFYTTDFLLHIMRDGYLIPAKMLVNTIQWIIILMICRWFIRIMSMEKIRTT